MNQDLIDLLKRARDRWLTAPTKGEYARNSEGVPCEPTAPEAACWCAYGALMKERNCDSEGTDELVGEASGAIGYILRKSGEHTWIIKANDDGVLSAEDWNAAIVANGGEP